MPNKIFALATLFIFLQQNLHGQQKKGFSGKLIYSYSVADTSTQEYFPKAYSVIYSNDSIIRIENFTEQFGPQVLIKHLIHNKSYLMIQTELGDYAIQTDYENVTTEVSNYTIKKKLGSTKIAGIKAKKLIVTHKDFSTPQTFYYAPKINSKYLNAYDEFPGLLLEYYVNSPVGLLKYQLEKIEYSVPDYSLFGIPTSFKKIAFDEFVKIMTSNNSEEQNSKTENPEGN
jgi:hypothetical protein